MKKMSFTKISFPQRFSQSLKSRPHTIKPMPGRHAVNSHATPPHTTPGRAGMLCWQQEQKEGRGKGEKREKKSGREMRGEIFLYH